MINVNHGIHFNALAKIILMSTDKIYQAVVQAGGRYQQLVVLVGLSSAEQTSLLHNVGQRFGWPCVNLNLDLSYRLLELSKHKRRLRAGQIVMEICEQIEGEVRLLDNIEMMFDLSLQLNPLQLLQSMARNRTLVVSWPGKVSDGQLLYANADHPEYCCYSADNLLVVNLGQA